MPKNLQVSKKSTTFARFFVRKSGGLTLGAVVQLVRIPACHAVGREFESRPHRQITIKVVDFQRLLLF